MIHKCSLKKEREKYIFDSVDVMKRRADGGAQLPLAKFSVKRRLRESTENMKRLRIRYVCVFIHVCVGESVREKCLIQ